LNQLEPTYRSGIEYQFNNAVVHNTWYFDTVCIYILVMYSSYLAFTSSY
jgi:hypothetical protein